MHFFNQQSLRNLHNLLSLFFPRSFGFISLILLGLAPCFLSAATINDLKFTLINGDTEYSVSALDPNTIAGAVNIPATYNGKPVTEIGPNAMGGSVINPVYQPAITSVTIPSSIKVIRDEAFYTCRFLTTVTFAPGSQLTTIQNHAFASCPALASIDLPDSLTHLGTSAFSGCSSLTSIDLSQTGLTHATGAFSGCTSLISVLLPDTLTNIGYGEFSDCNALTSIEIPQSVTSIGIQAFQYCEALTSIVIPQGVTSIGEETFHQCYNLASVTLLGSAPTLGIGVFLDAGRDAGGLTITVYEAHEASYASWATEYTVNVVPDPNAEPVILLVTTHYNPTSKTLGIITHNEANLGTLSLQHTASLGDAWTTLSTLAYIQATDSSSGAVTRSVTINPDTHSTGFYRLVSTD